MMRETLSLEAPVKPSDHSRVIVAVGESGWRFSSHYFIRQAGDTAIQTASGPGLADGPSATSQWKSLLKPPRTVMSAD
jgi:hypothetical protein